MNRKAEKIDRNRAGNPAWPHDCGMINAKDKKSHKWNARKEKKLWDWLENKSGYQALFSVSSPDRVCGVSGATLQEQLHDAFTRRK